MVDGSHEFQLDETIAGLRMQDSYAEPIGQIYTELSSENPLLKNKYQIVDNLLTKFVFDKKVGLVFSHKENRYFYRTSISDKKAGIQIEEGEDSLSPAEHILNMGDCNTFFNSLIQVTNVIEAHKGDSKWFEHMSSSNIWERATLGDLDNPSIFLDNIRHQIENGGLPFTNWTPIGQVLTRNGSEVVLVKDSYSQDSYFGGPHTLHIASTQNQNDPEAQNQIHSVVFGLDSNKQATIYSVQLDPIEGQSIGRMKNTDKNINLALHILRLEVKTITNLRAKLPDILEGINFTELNIELQRIDQWLKENGDPSKGYIPSLLTNLSKSIDNKIIAERVKPILEKRNANLNRCNQTAGGAPMISFMTAVALLRARGIEKIRLPVYLPFEQHTGKEPEVIHKELTDSLIKRVQIFRDLTNIPEVEEDGVSFVQLDISSWNIDLAKLNRETKQLLPLIDAIKDKAI